MYYTAYEWVVFSLFLSLFPFYDAAEMEIYKSITCNHMNNITVVLHDITILPQHALHLN